MTLKGLSEEQKERAIPERTILLGYVGSISHGTYIKQYGPNAHDDKDLMGIYIAPKHYYFGLSGKKGLEQKLFMERGQDGVEWDITIYEVRKMIGLLLKCNPNVLSLLWLPESLYITKTPEGDKILKNRDLFVSKQAFHSFIGYANGQLKRIIGVSTGKLGLKRKELVEAFGYDCKNGSHLIRLLRLGIEFLVEGKMNVVRPDSTELLDIKQGKWSLEKVEKEANELFRMARDAYIKSTLPPEPDYVKAESMLIDILESAFSFRNEWIESLKVSQKLITNMMDI